MDWTLLVGAPPGELAASYSNWEEKFGSFVESVPLIAYVPDARLDGGVQV